MSLSVIPKNRDFGITYEVTNQKGVKSYLIGTMHAVDKESVQDPAIMEIIGKCSALYSELGTNLFITSAAGSMPEGDHQYSTIPLRHTYDIAITLAAWCKKIPIISLDRGVVERDDEVTEYHEILQAVGADRVEEIFMFNSAIVSCDPNAFRDLQTWKNSDLESMQKHRVVSTGGDKRENHWLKTLIPKLLETEQPIAIAVGAGHVLGKDSLSERFAESGLKVALISPRPRSRL